MTSCMVTVFSIFFKQLPSLSLPVATQVQHVTLVFVPMTSNVVETGVSCLTTNQDMFVRYVKKLFDLKW